MAVAIWEGGTTQVAAVEFVEGRVNGGVTPFYCGRGSWEARGGRRVEGQGETTEGGDAAKGSIQSHYGGVAPRAPNLDSQRLDLEATFRQLSGGYFVKILAELMLRP
jgi:hypothetical protein